jgi:hypothetical protein
LACQEEFFVNITPDIKENDENALDFALHPSHIVKVSVALFPRFAQNLMHIRCSFVASIAKSHVARYTIPHKWT